MRRMIFPALITLAALFPCLAHAAARDKWVEVRSPNFVVVSNSGEGAARKIATQFEQIRALFRQSLPYANAHASPLIIILAVKDEQSLSELLPEYWAEKGHTHPAGIFLNRFYQFQIAVNLSAEGDNPYESIYHEYYHSLTVPYFPGLPVWTAEGMADFYGNSYIGDSEANVGMPDAGLLYELQNSAWLPLDTLFKVDYSSPYYNEQKKVSIFYAESWALTHYLMLGDKQSHRQAFGTYLNEIDRGTASDVAATMAFGDLGKLQTALELYVRSTLFYQMKAPAPAKTAEGDLHVKMLSDAEADAYRGGFLGMHDQFAQAEPLLQEAARLDPSLALAQENLALLHLFHNQPADALSAASTAIALDPKNATTRYLRAFFEFNSGAQVQNPQIEEDLRQAIATNPDFAPPYGLLAIHLANGSRDLPEALSLAQKGISLEPANANFVFAGAQVLARMRRYDDAELQARKARTMAKDSQTQQQVDQFLVFVAQARQYDAAAAQRQAAANAPSAASQPGNSTGTTSAADRTGGTEVQLRRNGTGGDSGGGSTLEGVITQVRCTGNEMLVSLSLAPGIAPLGLHAKDHTTVDYTSDIHSEGEIQPCTGLKGHTVKIVFDRLGDADIEGEIRKIEVEK